MHTSPLKQTRCIICDTVITYKFKRKFYCSHKCNRIGVSRGIKVSYKEDYTIRKVPAVIAPLQLSHFHEGRLERAITTILRGM